MMWSSPVSYTHLNLYDNIRKNEITIIGNAGADQPYHPYVAGEAWGNTCLLYTSRCV